jgi:hypothetical protein
VSRRIAARGYPFGGAVTTPRRARRGTLPAVTDFWIGSDEWNTWWDGEPAVVVRDVPSDGTLGIALRLVRVERTGEEVLIGRFFPLPLTPGRPLGVTVYEIPGGWDRVSPLRERELRFHSEAGLYARPEELPVVTAEQRERRRRGWAY